MMYSCMGKAFTCFDSELVSMLIRLLMQSARDVNHYLFY